MKRIYLSIFIAVSFLVVSRADVVNTEVASQVAKNHFWNYSGTEVYEDITLHLSYTETVNGLPVYYVFDINTNSGFVIVAADDDVNPILGYSFERNYKDEMDNLPPNFSAWMKNYTDQIVYVRENLISADETIVNKWDELLTFNFEPGYTDNVDPLLTTNWDQNCYYNALCPPDNGGPCGHVYVGCVATAMGQVMKYHNYPEQGSGSHSYYCQGYGTQSANFGATTYDWTSMPNQLYSNNTAVATLLYHCGVGVDMQYSASGSGAFSSDARDALVDYFTYSSDAQLLTKSSFSATAWENKLKNDLNAGRPLYYAGYGGSVGHAFVCDGYQGTNYFHFNWGWSGWYNGYFYVNNLNPGGYTFNQNQEAIFYVYPEGSSTLTPPDNLQAEIVNNNDVQLTWDAPSGKDLLGYNVYRNNENINYTTEINYFDENLDPGTYEYYVTAVYDEGESIPSASASVLIGGGTNTIFSDDFEAYNAAEQLVCQNSTDWTTWSNNPCSTEDPYISTDQAYIGSNSVIIQGTNDLVKPISDYTTGLYKISFYIYVPNGFLGYFNTLQDFAGSNSLWGMQVFFDDGGVGSIDGGGQTAATFTFQYNTWLYNEVIVDLNNDWAEYKLEGNTIHGWVWSTGAFGQNNMNQLGGSNFYAWAGDKGTPKFYVDDYLLEELGVGQLNPPTNLQAEIINSDVYLTWDEPQNKDLIGYNVYHSLNGGGFNLLDLYTAPLPFIHEDPGSGLHQYFVTALYDEGESEPSNTVEVLITAINENTLDATTVFPNPAIEQVNISSDYEIKTIKVFNYVGQVVADEEVNSKFYQLNTSQFNTGIYFFQVETNEGIISRRIIIK
ncbi:MAG: C10 family peptidase [Bacteroidetes bacterium]|nr:C10 family peptidase [Bacteroidota bacterium]MBL7103417.1 C10 family peptidase [Bacteroidales bacterium]